MAILDDLYAKRNELYNATEAYRQAVLSEVTPWDLLSAKSTAQIKGDEYARLVFQVKRDDPTITDIDQLFSQPLFMGESVRDEIAVILMRGHPIRDGTHILIDTEGDTAGAADVALPFAAGSDVTIDWGDGSGYVTTTRGISHTYAVPGIYDVHVLGAIAGFTAPLPEHQKQWKNIWRWGLTTFASGERMFQNRTGFVINDADSPAFLPGTSCRYMFYGAADFNSNISHWDMSNVIDTSHMFREAAAFNLPLNQWNVSGVVDMTAMFNRAVSYNQPLEAWDVSGVETTMQMFSGAESFNQPLNSWDVSSVTNMNAMFFRATAFNLPLNDWGVGNVVDMGSMFYRAGAFNRPLSQWDVSKVTNMSSMFSFAGAFNQDLSGWTVSQVTLFGGFSFDSNIQTNYLPNF
jgi:surface protein